MNKENEVSIGRSLVKVEAIPSTTHALKGVVNDLHLLFKISTGHVELEQKRPPINLAIVLDRSGSMESHKKLHNAKEAIIKVIEQLGHQDVLHLVLYGSYVEVAFENANTTNKEQLVRQVRSVQTEGMTNLCAGLLKGAELVQKYHSSGYNNRIFLFSDGLVNEGIQNKSEIAKLVRDDIKTERDVKVSAFGLGEDFDEELMKSIAESGSGSYFFIEGSGDIPRFVAFALKGILKLVGSDTFLTLRGLNNAIVTKIYGHSETLDKPFRLDDLKQDDQRKVICELQVKPDASKTEEEVLCYSLSYRPAYGAEHASPNQRESIEGTVRLIYTDDADLLQKNSSSEVHVQVTIQKTAVIDEQLESLIDQGKAQEAIVLQEQQLLLLKSVVEQDEGGHNQVAGLLAQAERALHSLQIEGASKKNKKEAHHRGYMKRRNSACYTSSYV